jgi:hypothetical protein
MGLYREPLIGDESRLERTADEADPRRSERGEPPTRSDAFVQGFDPLRGGLQVNPRRIDRLLGGVSGAGAPGSVAGRLWRAAKEYDGSTYYAVTERRLLLLGAARPGSGEYRSLCEVPRAQVASATRRGKILLQRGRVEVHFADGSMKAWTTAMLTAARGRSLVAALSERSTQTGT